jgi:hypothetical protein
MTVLTLDFTEPPAGRESCDFCGEWHPELRLMQFDGWTADSNTCRECFGTHDGPDFTDLALIQEAIRYA